MEYSNYLYRNIVAVLCLTFCPVSSQGPFVRDVALNKPITANVTCGTLGQEQYFDHNQVFTSGQERLDNEKTCANVTQFPQSAMTDGIPSTVWQSTSRSNFLGLGFGTSNNVPDAIINLDLEQMYKLDRITLRMGDAKRPGRIAIRRGISSVLYQPWIYLVNDEAASCGPDFMTPVRNVPASLDSVVCRSYGRVQASSFEEITYDFTQITDNLDAWRDVHFIRIEFYDIDLTLGPTSNRFHHYSVATIEVLAECACNGQEIACDQADDSLKFECTCGGFTQGRFCDQCQPLYNQNEFTPGQPCQQCNCFKHADACYFDPVTANFSLSLNTQGERLGGGVCISCRDNTTGVNCERCVDYFYRPDDRQPDSDSPCVPCQCHRPGVRLNEETQLAGDCVRNDAGGMLPAGMLPGDCFCKINVQGAPCDQCQVGFFNLTENNPGGCQECLCSHLGSVAPDSICDPDAIGECPCKDNVHGRQCDTCKDGFFDLSVTNDFGCTACECDPGASFNNVCELISGECPCRSNIRDRQCLRPMSGYYFPGPHFIQGQFEDLNGNWGRDRPGYSYFGYAITQPGTAVSAYLAIPLNTQFSNSFRFLLRYSGNNQPAAGVLQVIQSGIAVPVLTDNNIIFTTCVSGWCYYTGAQVEVSPGQTYQVIVSSDSTINMDQVVAYPGNYDNADAVLGTTLQNDFRARCNSLENNLAAGSNDETFCQATMFSLSMFYLDGALPCDCHPLGSFSNETCQLFDGQCPCKPGVFTRQCSECQLEFYQLMFDGCSPCDCATDDKVCDRFSGQCTCPPNTQGRRCDSCQLNNFNWTSSAGCQDCECSLVGSSNLQCDLNTGVCECKQGVVGDKCEQCTEGSKGFGFTGCSSCQCNVDGSAGTVCDPTSGQCPCKANNEGLLCELCKEGTFYNLAAHTDGCLDCVCMGITKDCQSSLWHQKTVRLILENSTDPTLSRLMLAPNGQVLDVFVPIASVAGQNMAQVDIGQSALIYWQHPDFHGDLVALYEGAISFTVFYTSTDPAVTTVTPSLFIHGYNNAVFEFAVPEVQMNQLTDRSVIVSVENVIGTNGINITRGELLLALTDVTRVLIPAHYITRAHTSYISDITYKMADRLGTGDRALGVEDCQCPEGYGGLSCEQCASGYRRENVSIHQYRGLCVPCECNGHSLRCDEASGECLNCGHNTEGFNCQVCKDGYYGDATSGLPTDCSECPCVAPLVVNSTCESVGGLQQCLYCSVGHTGALCDECEPDYFQNPVTGACEPCTCNGNSDLCSPETGVCVDCKFTTTGAHCELCAPGFYGNASAQSCVPCGCNMLGSVNDICDPESGNCSCYDGVTTRTCGSCLPGYYGLENLNIIGCVNCDCNPQGSRDIQCDNNGICPCLLNVQASSSTCDVCIDHFWGLPDVACSPCGCDISGSVDPTVPCNLNSGECLCKSGVAGRQCEECDHLYMGTPQIGCTKCGRCEDALGNDTLALESIAERYLNESLVVLEVSSLDPVLQNLSADINESLTSLDMSQDRLGNLSESLLLLDQSDPQMAFSTVQAEISTLTGSVIALQNDSLAELERLQSLQSRAEEAFTLAQTLSDMSPQIIARMTFYNDSAYRLLELGNSIYINMNETFDVEERSVQTERAAATVALTQARQIEASVLQQSNATTNLAELTVSAQGQLNTLGQEVGAVSLRLLMTAFEISSLYVDLNITQYNRERAETLQAETQTLLDVSNTLIGQIAGSYAAGETLLRDAIILHNGGTTGALPIDTTVDLTGISGWLSASDALASELTLTNGALTIYQQAVTTTEQAAGQLTLLARDIQEAFLLVQPRGQDAVNAINNYQRVVDSLMESLQMALQANETMVRTQRLLQAVSVTDLAQQSTQSLQASRASLQAAEVWNDTAATLEPLIQAANNSLQEAIIQWSAVNGSLTDLQREATALSQLDRDNTLTEQTVEANSLAERTMDTAQSVSALNEELTTQVDGQAEQLATIQAVVQNTTRLEFSIQTDLENFQNRLSNVQTTISQTESDHTETTQRLTSLQAKLAAIELKLERARRALVELEQPVHFPYTTFETMTNPHMGRNLAFTEVSFDFKYTYVAQGLLFFTEDTGTGEKVLIQLVDGQVVFEIRNIDDTMTTTSPAQLCSGCWFRVVASVYGLDGQLTVTQLSTGGVAVTSMRQESSQHELLQTTSSVYVGGLPEGFPLDNVYPNPQFEGCIYNMHYNGEALPIWQRALAAESVSRCCAQPPSLPAQATRDAVTFRGFGYIKLNRGDFSVQEQGQVTFEFRTFDADGVLLLLDEENTASYFGIFLRNGNVIFSIESDTGVQTRIVSTGVYNDGKWYKLSAVHDTTLARLSIQKVDFLPGDTVDTKSQSTAINLQSLSNATMTVGGQNPNTTLNRGPVASSFSGAMVDFQLSRGNSQLPVPKALAAFTGANLNVDLYKAFTAVVSGVGLDQTSGFVTLRAVATIMSTIEFQLLTTQHTGIITFCQLQASPPRTYFYIGLVNGDIMVLFDQGVGTQPPIRTRGLYLSTGQPHTIKVDVSSQNSPRLTVDGEIHYGAITMTSGMFVEGNTLYLLGIPPVISMETSLIPTSRHLIGGIRNLKINDQEVNVYNEVMVSGSYQQGMYLSGLPAPPDQLPPPPFPTTPPPPTTQPPTCAPAVDYGQTSSGMRFGDSPTGFVGIDMSGGTSLLRSAFSLKLEFRALHGDGILAYFTTGALIQNPTNYFVVYLTGGKLGVSMRSTTTRQTDNRLDTTALLSLYTYDDGQWWSAQFLRINDFMAIIVTDRKDYVNNGVTAAVNSQIEVEYLYLAGVDPTMAASSPFLGGVSVPGGAARFKGCIRNVEAETHNHVPIPINVANPAVSEGVTPCVENVAPGFFINGSNSYIRVVGEFHFDTTFRVRVAFSGSTTSGVLVSMWRSDTQFFYLQLYDGFARAVIGNTASAVLPLVAVSTSVDAFHVCDNAPHSIQLDFNTRVSLTVDDNPPESFPFPPGFQHVPMYNQPLYVGLPSLEWTPSLPGAHAYTGCILSISVRDVTYDLIDSTESRDMILGCPSPPITGSNP